MYIERNIMPTRNFLLHANEEANSDYDEQEQVDILEYLISHTSTWDDINEPNKDGLTPLYYICKNGHLDLTRKCVEEYKADVNAKGLLAVSLEFYHYKVAQYLISQGCNVDQVWKNIYIY